MKCNLFKIVCNKNRSSGILIFPELLYTCRQTMKYSLKEHLHTPECIPFIREYKKCHQEVGTIYFHSPHTFI